MHAVRRHDPPRTGHDRGRRQVPARARSERCLRRVDVARAVSHRRQEDDGVRAGRTARRRSAGRSPVSDRWRHRPGRHVESVRRDGGARLDSPRQAAALRLGTSGGLRAGREGIPRRRGAHRAVGECANARIWPARAVAARRLHLSARIARYARHCDHDRRGRDAARDGRARCAIRESMYAPRAARRGRRGLSCARTDSFVRRTA